MTEELRSVTLRNGLVIKFLDQTNRYFGDYHRICIKVTLILPDDFSLPAGMSRETAYYDKTLEKMGIPTADVADEIDSLIDAFLNSSQSYLEKDDFPRQLAGKIQQKNKRPVFLRGPKM